MPPFFYQISSPFNPKSYNLKKGIKTGLNSSEIWNNKGMNLFVKVVFKLNLHSFQILSKKTDFISISIHIWIKGYGQYLSRHHQCVCVVSEVVGSLQKTIWIFFIKTVELVPI